MSSSVFSAAPAVLLGSPLEHAPGAERESGEWITEVVRHQSEDFLAILELSPERQCVALVVERHRDAAGDLLGELQISGVVLAARLQPDERHYPEALGAGTELDDHDRASTGDGELANTGEHRDRDVRDVRDEQGRSRLEDSRLRRAIGREPPAFNRFVHEAGIGEERHRQASRRGEHRLVRTKVDERWRSVGEKLLLAFRASQVELDPERLRSRVGRGGPAVQRERDLRHHEVREDEIDLVERDVSPDLNCAEGTPDVHHEREDDESLEGCRRSEGRQLFRRGPGAVAVRRRRRSRAHCRALP